MKAEQVENAFVNKLLIAGISLTFCFQWKLNTAATKKIDRLE